MDSFQARTDALLASVATYDDVVALVLLGSTADPSRADRWSDHDFYLVVRPGRQERFRTHLEWLPDRDQVALAARETEHGLKVVYDDGRVLEFAVADPDEVATFGGTPYRVALDRVGLADRLAPTPPGPPPPDRTELELFLALLVIGAGRAARGEELSAGQLIREYAATRLVGVLSRHLAATPGVDADPYNPVRRFEARFPAVGLAVADALAQPPLRSAARLLELAEEHLGADAAYPRRAARAARGVIAAADRSAGRGPGQTA